VQEVSDHGPRDSLGVARGETPKESSGPVPLDSFGVSRREPKRRKPAFKWALRRVKYYGGMKVPSFLQKPLDRT